MYGPTSLPVTGAGATGLAAIVFGTLFPAIWTILMAATVITIGLVVVSFLMLHNNENWLKLQGRPVHRRQQSG